MHLKRVRIRNFFSFGDQEQEVDLSRPGLFLVTGYNEITNSSNGAGKSTILDSICFALYGKVTKDVNLAEIVNEKNEKDCCVELEFEAGGVNYIVKRYKAHTKFKDKLLIYKEKVDDEHLMSKGDKTDSQEELNRIIKINFKSFVNAVMLSQENLSSFIQTDSAKKKEIIENILQLETITKYHDIATKKRKIKKTSTDTLALEVQNLTNISLNTKETIDSYLKSCKKQEEDNELNILKLQGELASIEAINIDKEIEKIKEVDELARKMDNIKTKIDSKNETLQSSVETKKSIDESISEYNSKLEVSESEIISNNKSKEKAEAAITRIKAAEKLREEAEKLQREYDSKKTLYDHKNELIQSLKNERRSVSSSIDEYDEFISNTQTSMKKDKKELESIEDQISKLSGRIIEAEENPSLCPLCKNVINKDELDHWLKEKKEELEEKKKLLSQKKDSISANKQMIDEWNEKIVGLNKKKDEFNSSISKAEKEAKNIFEEFSSIEIPELDDFEDISVYENTINEKNKKIASLETEIKEFSSAVKKLQSQKNVVNEKINEIKNEISLLQKEYDEIVIPDIKSEKELKELQEKKIEVITKIEELKKKKFIDEEYLKGLKEQIKDYVDQLRDRKKEYKKAKKDLVVTQWWEDGLSSKKNSMKSWCISNINGYFNARIKFYMDRFFDGEVNLQLDNDLNEKISFVSKGRSYGQFSGGEKRRLNLAILFALNDIVKTNMASKLNIMFLDEVLSNYLDDKGISTVLDILSEMKQKKHSVWVIDHRDNFKDYPDFENIKIIKNKEGFSHISLNKK